MPFSSLIETGRITLERVQFLESRIDQFNAAIQRLEDLADQYDVFAKNNRELVEYSGSFSAKGYADAYERAAADIRAAIDDA